MEGIEAWYESIRNGAQLAEFLVRIGFPYADVVSCAPSPDEGFTTPEAAFNRVVHFARMLVLDWQKSGNAIDVCIADILRERFPWERVYNKLLETTDDEAGSTEPAEGNVPGCSDLKDRPR